MSTSALVHVPFHGGSIVTTADGKHIFLRPVCEHIGLDHSAQRQRLERQPWATVGMTPTVAEDGKVREMVAMDRKTFHMWLATIDTARLKNEAARELVTAYQCESADALDRYWNDGGALNPRATQQQAHDLIVQAQMQMDLCRLAKGLVHPDHLEAKARIVLARGIGETPELDPARRPLYTHDFLRSKDLSPAHVRSISGPFGKRMKAAYQALHGVAPQKYPLSLGNGQVREVFAYTEADRPLMEQVWVTHYEPSNA